MSDKQSGNGDRRLGLRRGDRRRQPRRLHHGDPPRPRRSCASPWSRSSPTRTPSSGSAATSSRPRACRRSNASACSSRSWRRGACARGSTPGPAGAGSKPPPEEAGQAVNLRREVLDPLVREAAADDRGRRDDARADRARPAARRRRPDRRRRRSATAAARRPSCGRRLVIGADGRDSKIAELAGVKEKTLPNERFAYGGYFEGEVPRVRARRLDLVPRPALGRRLPDRRRAHLLRGDADQGTAFPSSRRTRRRRSISFLDGLPDGPPIKRVAAGRTGGRQARHDQPGPGPGRARGWRWSATPRWPPTRSSASAAAGRSSRANGWPTRSRPRCAARSRWNGG